MAGVLRDHRLSLLATESLLKFRHVLDDAIRPPASRRVRIDAHQHPRHLGRHIGTPYPREPEEEALIRRISVDLLLWVLISLRQQIMQGSKGYACAAVICGVLAQR